MAHKRIFVVGRRVIKRRDWDAATSLTPVALVSLGDFRVSLNKAIQLGQTELNTVLIKRLR
jgi:hypothetical protein